MDSATLPDNRELLRQLDTNQAAAEHARAHQRELASRLTAAVPNAVVRIEPRVTARDASYAFEENLRGGVAAEPRDRRELLLTEAKVRMPPCTENLGELDLAIEDGDLLVVRKTDWADGNLYERMWNIYKLARATAIQRVGTAVAVYGAPVKQSANENGGASVRNRQILSPPAYPTSSEAAGRT